ncbi:MAG: hypothetical protein MUF15_19070 [Acidobacteria bacterium]|jgi:hypothetical protein|nr:hypothetical protein [Acidobacteriota bacterium]
MELGNDSIDEFLQLLEIPETREVMLEFKEKVKIIFKEKIEGFAKIKRNSIDPILEYEDDEPCKIIHMNKNWKEYREVLAEYEFSDRELREYIHYLLTFPFFRQMVLQEFYLKTKPFFKNKFDEYIKKIGEGAISN